jgi:hypothetical protein
MLDQRTVHIHYSCLKLKVIGHLILHGSFSLRIEPLQNGQLLILTRQRIASLIPG